MAQIIIAGDGGGGGGGGGGWTAFTPVLFSASGGDTIPTFVKLIGEELVTEDNVQFWVYAQNTSGGTSGSGSGQLGITGFSYDVAESAADFSGTGWIDTGSAVYPAAPYAEDLVAGVYISRTFSIGGGWLNVSPGTFSSAQRGFYIIGSFPKGAAA